MSAVSIVRGSRNVLGQFLGLRVFGATGFGSRNPRAWAVLSLTFRV